MDISAVIDTDVGWFWVGNNSNSSCAVGRNSVDVGWSVASHGRPSNRSGAEILLVEGADDNGGLNGVLTLGGVYDGGPGEPNMPAVPHSQSSSFHLPGTAWLDTRRRVMKAWAGPYQPSSFLIASQGSTDPIGFNLTTISNQYHYHDMWWISSDAIYSLAGLRDGGLSRVLAEEGEEEAQYVVQDGAGATKDESQAYQEGEGEEAAEYVVQDGAGATTDENQAYQDGAGATKDKSQAYEDGEGEEEAEYVVQDGAGATKDESQAYQVVLDEDGDGEEEAEYVVQDGAGATKDERQAYQDGKELEKEEEDGDGVTEDKSQAYQVSYALRFLDGRAGGPFQGLLGIPNRTIVWDRRLVAIANGWSVLFSLTETAGVLSSSVWLMKGAVLHRCACPRRWTLAIGLQKQEFALFVGWLLECAQRQRSAGRGGTVSFRPTSSKATYHTASVCLYDLKQQKWLQSPMYSPSAAPQQKWLQSPMYSPSAAPQRSGGVKGGTVSFRSTSSVCLYDMKQQKWLQSPMYVAVSRSSGTYCFTSLRST
eukprot:gene1809-33228_t